ncbi:gamma-glutamyltransferase [Flavilitoribacter nigricans]|uniref:gamma-glutamyltransferase n=1 Tax=Flavilitoribacter nigricans TaxID=70997 RepID=UPI001473F4D4|nr:gamma-glutamyltransferase [Flavilitoribacter nigricans]
MAFSAEGRLVVAWRGDLWLVETAPEKETVISGSWRQLTSGIAEERDPVWLPDGRTLLFASDRAGKFDLWKIAVPPSGKPGNPEVVIESPGADIQPSVAGDGTICWVRGLGANADIWVKNPEGKPTQLTSILGPDHSPAIHADGNLLVYISERKGKPSLVHMDIADKKKRRTILDGKMILSPQWSPDGQQLSFSTRTQPTGVWTTDLQGSYTNLISTSRSLAVWSSDGSHLILVETPRNPPAYNGDPQPAGVRPDQDPYGQDLKVAFLPAPIPPDRGQQYTYAAMELNSARQYLDYFDRTVNYLNQKYQLADHAAWNTNVQRSREAVKKADSTEAVDQLVYQLLRQRPPLREEKRGKAGISSAHPLATAAGLRILEQGGNVVDAAIAISFALGVVEPDASGLGGYGEMLIYLKDMESPTCIEFLTRVPEAGSLTNGQLQNLPGSGPMLVNVPGTVAGMELAWQKYGSKKLSWADLVQPAIELARDGFPVSEGFASTLEVEKEAYATCDRCQSLFYPEGKPLTAGDTLRNPDLAWTLAQIARRGRDGFYQGPVAQRMVEDLRSGGNVMSTEDLARYYAVERTPVRTQYRGHTIYSGPPPVSGGALLTAKLNLLEGYPAAKPYTEDAATLHAMIEAWKLSPSTSGRIADPGLWPVDLDPFTDKTFAGERWQSCFNAEQSVMPADSNCLDTRVAISWGAEGILEARSSTGTTAFAVADAAGNMVSVTQTLGTWGGNFYVTPGLGFIYNDKLRSYNSNPKRYNARIPFARNVTSISPTMIFKATEGQQQPLAALGAAGNAWISSAVYQMCSGIIDQGLGPQAALELPRFLVGVQRDNQDRQKVKEIVVQMEQGFAPAVLKEIQQLGHELQLISAPGELRMGYGAAVMIDRGVVRAGADPRRSGEAGVVE